ncbi:MAG: xanthine dehydrogenase family protein subunit M [Saprospiraceae bacterium]|nr:xanthine dehydrogenase family protein subunit M [Saprospiraceae bacterium]
MSFPSKFDYVSPQSLEEVSAFLYKNEGAKILAGGHELIPLLKKRNVNTGLLVDLKNIKSLKQIRINEEDNSLVIGSMVSCDDLISFLDHEYSCPALMQAAKSVGDAQVRNWTTIGGNIASGNPAADLAAPLQCLDAKVNLIGHNGRREVNMDQFFVGPFETALEKDEVIDSIHIPYQEGTILSGYEKIKIAANSYPLCGVAMLLVKQESGKIQDGRIAITGASIHPRRLYKAEALINGRKANSKRLLLAVLENHDNVMYLSDEFGSSEYRRHMTQVLVENLLNRLV